MKILIFIFLRRIILNVGTFIARPLFGEITLQNTGITLIALIITIIILLILAGVTLNFTLGENGILKYSQIAKNKYNEEQEKEKNALDEMYSQILVAEDSKVTLTMEQLDEYIKSKMTGNSIGDNTVDYYNLRGFSITSESSKSMLSGNSKFGTIDENGYLTFNTPGLYYVSSEVIITDTLGGQLYNIISVNNIAMTRSFSYKDNSGIPATVTFYANSGDKMKIDLNAYDGNANIYSWGARIYKIY